MNLKHFIVPLLLCLFHIVNGQSVIFSEPSGIKRSSFTLELSTETPNRTIYYTTDGSQPTQNSAQYTSALQIQTSTLVSAISYSNGVPDSLISRSGYIFLSAEMSQFSSNLPILIISNLGQGDIPAPEGMGFPMPGQTTELLEKQFCVSALFEPENGRTTTSLNPTLEFNSGIKVRGSSSSSFPKKSYGYDAWNEQSEETNIEPLGLAESADWVLHGSRNQDPTYIRSILPFTLSNQMGQWAPRSIAIELFVHTGNGNVTMNDHLGLYFFMEKIGRGKDKLDIEKLDYDVTADNPDISGGYIIKVDRLDAEATGFSCLHAANSFTTTNYYYPKERNMPEYQKPWIRDYISQFENVLQQIPSNRNYTQYFDVQAAIDHWILKAVPKDADAFVLSEFFHKDRNGIIKMGPIWDLDRSSGSIDNRTTEWNNWCGDQSNPWGGNGTLADYWEYGWYGYLHDDPEYMQALKDRWFEIRQEQFSFENIDFIIDSLTSVMQEAMVRDVQLWPIESNDGTFQTEMNVLKQWYHNRITWVDEQFGYTPVYKHNNVELTGNYFFIEAGYQLEISAPSSAGGGIIYYTTDGSDPRLEGGSVNPNATQYQNMFSIPNPMVVKSRIYNNGSWSNLRSATFYLDQDLSQLKITEINYNPRTVGAINKDEFEFIELKNTGTSTLYLAGVSFTEGVEFTFPANATVAAGEFILIVSNAQIFQSYTGIAPDYEYEKQLSNNGETLQLSDIKGDIITEVEYGDEAPWPSTTDGLGFTLVPIQINPPADQNDVSLWRASSTIDGSPGADDILTETLPVLVNEALSNSSGSQVDAIELYNPNNQSVDISGWHLSDDPDMSTSWTIPQGTTIDAHSYMTFYEGHFEGQTLVFSNNEFGNTFSLNSNGDDAYIFATQGGNLTGYSHGIDLDACRENISYGEWKNSIDEKDVVALKTQTFNMQNSEPLVGPLVISSIYYNPIIVDNQQTAEFISIKNISDSTVYLFDPLFPTNTWKINGLSFSFAQNISVASGETVYLKSDDVSNEAFKARYSLTTSTQVFDFVGSLDNNGETITIQMPLTPYNDNGESKIPYANVDKVKYRSTQPWPDANGNGKMLQRINNSEYGNDPANWISADASGISIETYKLTVNGGTGSGSYPEFDVVTISATVPQGYIFNKWTSSDDIYIEDVLSETTTFKMQGYDVEISAEFTEIISENIISSGDMWYYNNTGTDLGTMWLSSSYNSTTWAQGSTSLGQEDVISTPINIGPENERFPTIYFIKKVLITGSQNISSATVSLLYDDGAVIYINGSEAFRVNMPDGSISYSTYATSHEATAFETYQISPDLFVEGDNIIQVEIHNASANSSDLVFDMSLDVEKGLQTNGTDTQSIVLLQGWNLISLNVEPNNPAIETLFPNATKAKNFDAFYDKDDNPALNSLTELHAGNAVYLYNTISETIHIKGNLFTGFYAYNLSPGWNIIGVPRSFDVPVQSVVSSDILFVKDANYFYDGSIFSTLSVFTPGNAYLVKTNKETYIAFDEE